MISIIITAYKEAKTIGRAIERIKLNKIPKSEIIVVAPDKETLDAAKKFKVKTLKDAGRGKSAALNLAVSKANGEILVLTDGDVFVSSEAVKKLISHFDNKKIGAVSGRPVSISPRDKKYGFWGYVLSEVAHERRLFANKKGLRFFCSGYLFAIRKKLFPKLREYLLSEDGFISHQVYEKKFRISYEPKAEVYIKYPDNFKDWIIQKKRSAGGYSQIKKITGATMRSFKSESSGASQVFRYVRNIQEIFWVIELFFARVYLWALIKKDVSSGKKSSKEIWQRVESTK